MEAVRDYGPNILSFEVATGGRRWYIIVCYLAPDDARKIERVVTALGDQPRGTALLVAGDFNMDLGDTANNGRGAEIAAALTEAGVEDMMAHFLPRKQPWGRERQTWSIVREGRVIRSCTDYLLGTDRSLFRNVAFRDPRHSDHFMVVGHLNGTAQRSEERRVKAMVHHRILPLPQRRSDDRAGSPGAGGPTARHLPISGGGLQYGSRGDGKRRERNGDCSGAYRGRGRRHDGALPPKEATMGKGAQDVEYGEGGKGDKVSDGLPPGN